VAIERVPGWERIGLAGDDAHDRSPAAHTWARARWFVFAGCLIAIPAFHVELLGLASSTRYIVESM
jgi:voltage-gated potassium channel